MPFTASPQTKKRRDARCDTTPPQQTPEPKTQDGRATTPTPKKKNPAQKKKRGDARGLTKTKAKKTKGGRRQGPQRKRPKNERRHATGRDSQNPHYRENACARTRAASAGGRDRLTAPAASTPKPATQKLIWVGVCQGGQREVVRVCVAVCGSLWCGVWVAVGASSTLQTDIRGLAHLKTVRFAARGPVSGRARRAGRCSCFCRGPVSARRPPPTPRTGCGRGQVGLSGAPRRSSELARDGHGSTVVRRFARAPSRCAQR